MNHLFASTLDAFLNGLKPAGFSLEFDPQYLRAGMLVSLLSVWVLVGVFYYLNRYTKRRYFTIWTAAWLFYAVWLTLNLAFSVTDDGPGLQMIKLWCMSFSAVFLLWGSIRFLGQRAHEQQLGLFMIFLLVWSWIGTHQLGDYLEANFAETVSPLLINLPIFGFIGLASMLTAYGFLRYRRRRQFIAAGLLAVGFLFWGGYLIAYPFLLRAEEQARATMGGSSTGLYTSAGFFLSSVLQLFIAVSMIILVLEQVRFLHQRRSLLELKNEQKQKTALQSKVISTEERFRNLFERAGEAIVITASADLRMLELNQAAEHLLGITRSESVNRQSLTAFCQLNVDPLPKDGPGWFELIRHRTLNLVRKNGSVVPTEASGSPVEFDGQPAYQFFFREVTERSRLEQQLRQAEKLSALGQMISGVAHELNNPLAVIKGYLELILAHHDLPAKTRADLEKVAQESSRAGKLVRNFLSFAREQPAHRELINFNEYIQRVIDLRKFDFMAAKVEPATELDPDLPKTVADPDQIQQVLIILVSNALQAMAEAHRPGRLKITTQRRDQNLRILVEDDGPGVPKHIQNKIFEPFFTTKEVGKGTGLGLSLAHSILTEHQGRITYQESTLGGAAFVLELPIVNPQPQETAFVTDTIILEAKKPVEPVPQVVAKVLVLDDEKALAEMLGEMLSLLGHTPTLCNAASDALERLDREDFDLILSDIRMPRIDGPQFYKLATGKKPDWAARFIFLTGDVVNEETQDFLKTVGNPYIPKPFHLSAVEEAVANVLRQNRRHGVTS
ncbi:MAG: response regulator [Verrucomicrobia bacterium]|nr:response regulator [Verrucomicrobiota bacterium]